MPDTVLSRQSPPNAADLPDLAVSISGLSKVYGGQNGRPKTQALTNVDLAVPRGAFFGLLGPNGAGKSTMINIMAGLVNKTSGTVRLWDFDIVAQERRARCAIGIVPQELNLDPFFSPRETLEVQAGLYGVPKAERRTDEILDSVGLSDKADSYSRTLSGGMRRRLLIAKAMVHSPPILVLDEPTAGVDVELRKTLWKSIREMNARGTTILLTTHYLEEAEELCDQIAIINHGQVVACDTTDALLKQLDNKTVVLLLSENLEEVPQAMQRFDPRQPMPNQLEITYRPSSTAMLDILQTAHDIKLPIADIVTEEVDLEDIFLQLTRSTPETP
ncbi:MAG: ABC transporter ATP-binding protein [Rhodospirillaceae bacterium]|mgnify:FL=1|jgi:ABC-2 type transport system ATP-binding protein|nr:ABC transporter ATP-binding protein [Rhodospirillaceae bacterium]MBT5241996.1 ABC transporter ATP-binding protein [Rhodospirillaceae bacterium]MBT5565721.1 ABC transporter ATP-binding protein [Rhodospirillaceae bacterium]MBT6088552.1 ABC transporter ATP-binding protein [Rhodospirillaceae bacterium]MBT6960564.1 ABC transporter ATP-binding protein [Rhodospirillaceae bacterium]